MCDNKKTTDQLRKEIQEADEALERSRLELEPARKRRELADLRGHIAQQGVMRWAAPSVSRPVKWGGPYYDCLDWGDFFLD